MPLKIELGTPKGEAQKEAIEWAEEQMNIVLSQFFNNEYKLAKGLRFKFDFISSLDPERPVKVDLQTLEPQTIEKAQEAMKQAIEGLHLVAEKTDDIAKK